MNDALTAIGRYMSVDLAELRGVSQNAANANTSGYRSLTLTPILQTGNEATQVAGNPELPAGLQLLNAVSAAQGPLNETGRNLDFALRGNAYFCIQTSQGVRYTRNGNFFLGSDGGLVTSAGDQVLGTGGAIVLPSPTVSVNAKGQLSHDGHLVAKLELATLPSGTRLEPAGKDLYRAVSKSGNAPTSSLPAASSYEVRQGALEGSNAKPSDDMVQLIEISRHMESIQRAMLTYDQMLNSGINELGNK